MGFGVNNHAAKTRRLPDEVGLDEQGARTCAAERQDPTRLPCPRCGQVFDCGAAGPGPCVCTTVTLDAALLATLRRDFKGCLCLACLDLLRRAGMPADPPQR